jgi:hypothetical protein
VLDPVLGDQGRLGRLRHRLTGERRRVEGGDVDGVPEVAFAVEGPVELAGQLCRVADQQHARVLGGQEPLGGLEDLVGDTGRLVDDEQQMRGVVALEPLRLVGRVALGEPAVAALEPDVVHLGRDAAAGARHQAADLAPEEILHARLEGRCGRDHP